LKATALQWLIKILTGPGVPFSYRGTEAQDFANRFFDGIDVDTLRVEGKLSLKILIVKPDARLSWQYHHPRAEIWQVYKGEVGIIRSDNDTQGELLKFKQVQQIRLAQR
jgi:mannose-6-phosphate isomerase